jgi:hypothetical protein
VLSKIIVSSYSMLLEAAIWIILVSSFIGGWIASGFFAAIGALIAAFVFCVVVFGAFLTLVDIQTSVHSIEARQKPAP